MIKLIACDLDGTLLNDQKMMDQQIYDLLPRLLEKGIHFVVASGRQYPSLAKLFDKHKKEIILLAENGAYVVENEKELSASVMDKKFVHFCIDKISALPNVTPLVCARNTCYTNNLQVCKDMSTPRFHYNIKFIEDLYGIEEEIIKVSLYDHNEIGASAFSYLQLAPVFEGIGEIAVSGFACVDIVNKGVSKGDALHKLQTKWGITKEETAAFGDSYNDIEMLQQAKFSFAMANAEDGVKRHASFIAGSNNQGGVVKEIRRLLEM